MNYPLIVREEAEADLEEAYRWYEEQRKGLGDDFLLCVEAAIESVQEDPSLCPKIRKEVRRKLVRRFPFGIYYVLRDDRITVVAVLHCRRSPREWLRRVGEES